MPADWPVAVPVYARLVATGAARDHLVVPSVVVLLCDAGGAGRVRETLATMLRVGIRALSAVYKLGGGDAVSAVLVADRDQVPCGVPR